ncbi:MAG: hypothetical protein ACKOGB_09395, partial [Betaproteobacteria bacterium]
MNTSGPPEAKRPRPGRRQLLQGLGASTLWGLGGFGALGALGGCALAPQPAPPLRVARQLPEGAPVGRLL